jgi:arsenical-resistance protein 2
MASGEPAAAPWHAAYPTPRKTEPASISREALLDLMTKSNGCAAKDFLLIDLRRTDNEVKLQFSIYANTQCF